MTKEELTTIFMYFSECFHQFRVTQSKLSAWYSILKDEDGEVALQAAMALCRSDTPYPPTPGQLLHSIRIAQGVTGPPDLETAVGYYEAGIWNVHPMLQKVADSVYWDRFNAPERAIPQFRSLYKAALAYGANSLPGEPETLAPLNLLHRLPFKELPE